MNLKNLTKILHQKQKKKKITNQSSLFYQHPFQVTENVSRSIPITLDTSEAITKNSPTSATIAAQDLFSLFPTSTTSDFSALYANNKELILGFSAATFVFICLLIALLIVSRRQSRPADKVPLVDEEVGVNVDVERLTIHV